MYKYEHIIYWSAIDSKFIVEIPELSGCIADGNTIAEAIENAEVVISEWIETARLIGRDVPKCKEQKLCYA